VDSCGHLLNVKPKSNGQRVVEPKFNEVEESKFFFCLKQHATEELWAQNGFFALVQDFGKADAQEMFT